MKITHEKSGKVLGINVKMATSFWQRLRGYMIYAAPPDAFDGLYFPNCNIVHNSFVRFTLDVVFICDNNRVVKVLRGFRPWRVSGVYLKAKHVVEFPSGALPEKVEVGDQLILE